MPARWMHGPCRLADPGHGGVSRSATCPARHSNVAFRPQGPSLADSLARLAREVASCERCPRLRAWCREVAATRVRRFAGETYWGRPVPGFGDPDARLLIVGLAPAVHGANRTGRVFTGDRSGDFLFAAMHATGFANQPTSTHAADGLQLIDCAITGMCHCAPPGNKPLPQEIESCRPFLQQTFTLLPNLKGLLALGKYAFDASFRLLQSQGYQPQAKPRPTFAHGALHWFTHSKSD